MLSATRLLRTTSAIAFGTAALAALPDTAAAQQQAGGQGQQLEEIVVTGSYIRRATEAGVGAPISVIGRGDIKDIGASNIADIIQTLTINTGSQNNPDAFTQNLSTGTSNFNLRGLGVSSTLVLLNGRRQVVSGVPTDDGLLFVDTASLVPQIAIERLEVVKDGAAALYGSAAVAGVVNFITRNNFSGLELEGEVKAVTDEGSATGVRLGGIAGSDFAQGRGHATIAFEYFDQTPLTTEERRLSPRFGPDVSDIGQPGSFVPAFPLLIQAGQIPSPAIPQVLEQQLGGLLSSPGALEALESGFTLENFLLAGGPDSVSIPDPTCPETPVSSGPFRNSLQGTTPTGLNICSLDFGDSFNLVPDQTRLQGFARTDYEINDHAEFYGEFGFARNRTERNNSPTFPTLATFPIGGPATNSLIGAPPNPFNPFNVDLFGVFRPIGVGEFPRSEHDSDTWRVVAGLRGNFAETWRYDVNFVRAINDFDVRTRDALRDRFNAALVGLGGPDCTFGTPLSGRGQNGCEFFNPFGTANTAAPGDTVVDPLTGQPVPLTNSDAVIEDILAVSVLDFDSRLWTGNALVSGDTSRWFELPGGPIGIAVGGQFRHEEFGLDADDNLNRGNFLFVSGAGTSIRDFFGSRDTWAGFVEVAFPFTDWFEITAAGRFEDTQTVDSTLDPKVSAAVRPMEGLTLRGSFSTSFRSPSILQQESRGLVTLAQINDPVLGNTAFVGVFTEGNPNLEPEESDQFNVGFTYEPEPGFQIQLDFWHFDFTDLITEEDPQALVNSIPQSEQTGPNMDPRIVRGTGVPLLLQVNTSFVNAPSLETNGIDFGMSWQYETIAGTISPFIDGTLITEYEIADPSLGEVIDGKGSRNFLNVGAPTPPLRFNAGLNWNWGPHSFFGVFRFIDDFEDDQNCVDTTNPDNFEDFNPNAGCPANFEIARVDEQLTLDIQYTLAVHELLGWSDDRPITLTGGAINLTDERPPAVNTNSGFATRVHDPRGRLAYARLTIGF